MFSEVRSSMTFLDVTYLWCDDSWRETEINLQIKWVECSWSMHLLQIYLLFKWIWDFFFFWHVSLCCVVVGQRSVKSPWPAETSESCPQSFEKFLVSFLSLRGVVLNRDYWKHLSVLAQNYFSNQYQPFRTDNDSTWLHFEDVPPRGGKKKWLTTSLRCFVDITVGSFLF